MSRATGGHYEAQDARIETLEAELSKLGAAPVGYRADFERERCERLMAGVLTATARRVCLFTARLAPPQADGKTNPEPPDGRGEAFRSGARCRHSQDRDRRSGVARAVCSGSRRKMVGPA
jgi:hypothetical protein